jgi:hypothetical protein
MLTAGDYAVKVSERGQFIGGRGGLGLRPCVKSGIDKSERERACHYDQAGFYNKNRISFVQNFTLSFN